MPRDPFEELPHGRLSDLAANPFAGDPQGEAIVDNTVKTPEGAAVVNAPDSYATVQPHRGRSAFWFGVIGLVLATLSMAGFYWFPALPVIALPFTLLAWRIGKHELEGMRRGLVDRRGEVSARRGYWFGLVGTIVVAIEMLTAVAFVVHWVCELLGIV